MPDFSKLKPFSPRKFIAPDFTPTSWLKIKSYFDRLSKRALTGAQDTEKFLHDWNELSDVISSEAEIRYINMTCQTDDKKAAKLYEDFETKISPHLQKANFDLAKKYSESTGHKALPKTYGLFNTQIGNKINLFRKENIPLFTKESLVAQKYQKADGSLTAEFEGKKQTLTQISKILEERDRPRRESAWITSAKTRLNLHEEFDDFYDQLKTLRVQIAKNAGFKNYRDYIFAASERFDYTPEDCFEFHRAVEKHIVPLIKKLNTKRRETMKLTGLQPWDLHVDPLGRPPLKPFTSSRELIAKSISVLTAVDPNFGNNLQIMDRLGLLDLNNRKGKAPGGYQANLSESRLAFIFMNSVGVSQDVSTLLHESGHAANSFLSQNYWLGSYRNPPLEFAEVASMGMELLCGDSLDKFYSPEDLARIKYDDLSGIVRLFGWIAVVDEFQHWVYVNPDHSTEERAGEWLKIFRKYNGGVDWTGLEDFEKYYWHRQHHIFDRPFYYIEYGIAQLGALQLWQNYRKNPQKTVEEYKKALSLGGSVPLPKLFETAGLKFEFGEEIVAPMAKFLEKELDLAPSA